MAEAPTMEVQIITEAVRVEIARLELRPDDVLVFRADAPIRISDYGRISASVRRELDKAGISNRFLLLDSLLNLSVLAQAEATSFESLPEGLD